MATHNVVAEMGRLVLIPAGSPAWIAQRATILRHLAEDTRPVPITVQAARSDTRSR